MMSSETRTIRVISFGVKAKDYRIWARRFMSMGSIKGYRGVMTGKDTPPGHLVVIDESTKDRKKQLRLRNANERGYSELLLSVSDEVTFGIIDGVRTTDLP